MSRTKEETHTDTHGIPNNLGSNKALLHTLLTEIGVDLSDQLMHNRFPPKDHMDITVDGRTYRCAAFDRGKDPVVMKVRELLGETEVTLTRELPTHGRITVGGSTWESTRHRGDVIITLHFSGGVATPISTHREGVLWEVSDGKGDLKISDTLTAHDLLNHLSVDESKQSEPLTPNQYELTFEDKTYRIDNPRSLGKEEKSRLCELLDGKTVNVKRILPPNGIFDVLGKFKWTSLAHRGMVAEVKFMDGEPTPEKIYKGEKLWAIADGKRGVKLAPSVTLQEILDHIQVEESKRAQPLRTLTEMDITLEGVIYRCEIATRRSREITRIIELLPESDIIVKKLTTVNGLFTALDQKPIDCRFGGAVAEVRYDKGKMIPLTLHREGKLWAVGDGKEGWSIAPSVTISDLLEVLQVEEERRLLPLGEDYCDITFEDKTYRCKIPSNRHSKEEVRLSTLFQNAEVSITRAVTPGGNVGCYNLHCDTVGLVPGSIVTTFYRDGRSVSAEQPSVEIASDIPTSRQARPRDVLRALAVLEKDTSDPVEGGAKQGFGSLPDMVTQGLVPVVSEIKRPSRFSGVVREPLQRSRGGVLSAQEELRLLMHRLTTPEQWGGIAEKFQEAEPYLPTYISGRVGIHHTVQLIRQGIIDPFDDGLAAMSAVGGFNRAIQDSRPLFEEAGLKAPRVTDLDYSEGMLSLSSNPLQICSPVEDIPLANESMGFIECGSLHRLSHEARVAALNQFTRVLKVKGGIMLRVENLLFDEEIVKQLAAAGIETLSMNHSLVIPNEYLGTYPAAVQKKTNSALRQTRFYFGRKVQREGKPVTDFCYVKPLTMSEEVGLLSGCHSSLRTTKSDDGLARLTTRYGEIIDGISSEAIVNERRVVIGILRSFMRGFFKREEFGEHHINEAKNVEHATVMAFKAWEALHDVVVAINPKAESVPTEATVKLINYLMPLEIAAKRVHEVLAAEQL